MSAEGGGLPAVPRRVLGLVYLLVIVLFFGLTIALYQKRFTPVVPVDLRVEKLGDQLSPQADVKVRGVIVGEVRGIDTSFEGATLHLALDPGKIGLIPRNVTARLLPKTLFGERYVSLVLPRTGVGRIQAGDVIGLDHSSAAIELNRVLDNLMPVLQAVQPEKLSSTLGAVSQALSGGRGKELGQTLTTLDDYVRELNPALPDLTEDIRQLAGVADAYRDAAPDLLQTLSDLTVTSKTLVDQQQNLHALFTGLSATSADLRGFLEANRDNLIGLAGTSRSTLDLLAKYAPEYPCLLGQLSDLVPKLDEIWGGGANHNHSLNLTIEITASRGKYVPGKDTPAYTEKRGPACYPAATNGNFPQYPPGGPLRDGSTPPAAGGTQAPGAPSLANSAPERALVAALAGPSLGVAPKDVPQWSSVLLGPLYRGQEVTVR
ncbi:MCE family protein [Amycolatopsis acidiphila]|uniref:MCE family protein n=1 Tax=Amycolatopsis acidiphila TaxID=715473 RepID=A0A558AL30_9PSEU|nr:MCE family protein [Amycolatopsis acidiphila]TVT24978.1 MCE family protein [Amycolatopsis acidiphila]UIJ57516.1 MCE family protein [Amycolatopsis acidiphila]GHG96531.1 ABC transporter substrate-binding protein [Amycolatopsis acidiphila]